MSTPYKTVAFHTLGCKLNFSESSTIARNFETSGFRQVEFTDSADVYLINTCSVTDNADRKCRKIIRQIRRKSPDSIIAVTGCYAQLKPDELYKIDGVNLIVGNGEKFDIPSYIEHHHFNGAPIVHHSESEKLDDFHSSFSLAERTRAFLKIQDGCDYPCTYCTIPLARGKSRSDTVENVIWQAQAILNAGIQEIVLTGVNVGEFQSAEGDGFFELICALDTLGGLDRLRISSIEPNLLTDEIVDFISSSRRLVPHFHIPLQSGSDRILRLMRRRYNSRFYERRIQKIRSVLPHANIGADVIVGFPGETDMDFQQTWQFIADLDLSYLHVFSYSPRENTPAWFMTEGVPQAQIAIRSRMLHDLSDRKRRLFLDQFLSTTHEVLFESTHEGLWTGHTRNFIKVKVQSRDCLENTVQPVKLVKNCLSYMEGMIR